MNRRNRGNSTPRKSAARVKAELDWQPLCRKAVDFVEKIFTAKAQRHERLDP